MKWSLGTDGPLTGMAYSRESGELFVADQSGTLYRLDRVGNITSLTRLHHPTLGIAWSDDGSQGAIIADDEEVIRFDRNLKVIHKISLPDVCLAAAISPFGNHLAISLANGNNVIYNENKKVVGKFETIRPLTHLAFSHQRPLLYGSAEHGLVCCHTLNGTLNWQTRNWANVGQMSITGDGSRIYLASFAHGIQTLDEDGTSLGSYVLEGTVNRVSSSYQPERLVATTVEGNLYWMDNDGEMLWATSVPDTVVQVICDPLGEFAICGLLNNGIYRLDWAGI